MNYIKIENDKLIRIFFDEIDYKALIEQLVLDELTLFYIYDADKLVGVLDRNDVLGHSLPSLQKDYIKVFDEIPSSKMIQEILNSGMHRKLVSIVNGDVHCEYRNLEYGFFPRQIYRNFMALRYLDAFKSEFQTFFTEFGKNEIILLSEVDIMTYFQNEIEGIKFVWCKTLEQLPENSSNVILNFKYGKDYRSFISEDVYSRLLDFYYIAEKVVFAAFKIYCEERNVNYYFIKGSTWEKLHHLSAIENDCLQRGLTLNEILENDDITYKIARDESDFNYLKKRLLNATYALNNGFTIVESDIATEHLHIVEGVRKTLPEIEIFDKEIHMYGPCITSGYMVSDEHTIESYLQKRYVIENQKIKVFNHGTNNGQILLCDVINALNTPVKAGDDFVFIYETDPVIDALEIRTYDSNVEFNKRKTVSDTFFYDSPAHCNKYANELMAEYIYDLLVNKVGENTLIRRTYFQDNMANVYEFKYFNFTNPNLCSFFMRYHDLMEKLKGFHNVGGMLMHAAPFTLGHQYLIDTALNEMDAVVVFVMADYFHSLSVLDRVEIVKENLSVYDNVFVIPIEPFAIAASYFPAYMHRVDSMFKASDLLKYSGEIVDSYIFPYFNIKYRYLGEELPGSLTDRYNDLVKYEAEKHGLTVRIIKRNTDTTGNVISAGRAREALRKKDFNSMKRVLSNKTIEYLIKNELKFF